MIQTLKYHFLPFSHPWSVFDHQVNCPASSSSPSWWSCEHMGWQALGIRSKGSPSSGARPSLRTGCRWGSAGAGRARGRTGRLTDGGGRRWGSLTAGGTGWSCSTLGLFSSSGPRNLYWRLENYYIFLLPGSLGTDTAWDQQGAGVQCPPPGMRRTKLITLFRLIWAPRLGHLSSQNTEETHP